MTNLQRVIKYGAIAFGIYLTISIVGVCIIVLGSIFGVFVGMDNYQNKRSSNEKVEIIATDVDKVYQDITDIDIDLSNYEIEMIDGDEFRVQAMNVPNSFTTKVQGGTLKINDKTYFYDELLEIPTIKIVIPTSQTLDSIKVSMGVNRANIETLQAKKIDIKSGAGTMTINTIIADELDMNTGAGQMTVNNATIKKLDVNSGVGKCIITAKVLDEGKIRAGVGELRATLLGNKEDYQVKANTGIGSLRVDGNSITKNETIGNGKVRVKVESGVGRTVVDFKASSL